MHQIVNKKRSFLNTTITILFFVFSHSSYSQENTEESSDQNSQTYRSELGLINTEEAQEIEEIVVQGRYISAAQELINERMNDDNVIDVLDSATISRLGDSNAAAALRRLPGVTLMSDKYVYIRGLGERYSASLLNGAQIPSPDLTRNVVPLNVFPTSVINSLKIYKSWSPELPANFGGGSIDIESLTLPNDLIVQFEIGTGVNQISTGKNGLTYNGGSDDNWGNDDGTRAMPADLQSALVSYQGNLETQQILSSLKSSDASATLASAQKINRDLASSLNRNIAIMQKEMPNDLSLKTSIGNTFDVNDNLALSFLTGASYDRGWRMPTRVARNFNFPIERTDTDIETTYSVNLSNFLTTGIKTENHQVSASRLWLRNTDDETATQDFFNENRQKSDGRGFRNYRIKFEERNMTVNQFQGEHYFADLIANSPLRFIVPDLGDSNGYIFNSNQDFSEAKFSWFYSDADAKTDIPNQVGVETQTITDVNTGAIKTQQIARDATASDFRFTDLDDDLLNYGFKVDLPIISERNEITLSSGYSHARKVRTYKQTQFGLGPLDVADIATLQGDLSTAFSTAAITNTANNYVFDRQGTNTESYIAATMTDGVFGNVDWIYDNTWRASVGARWENYRQVGLSWNPYGYTADKPQISMDTTELQKSVFTDDKLYPAISLTYMSDFLAETFQLRFNWSETTVRPDLREITDASYIDPITGDLTRGNSGVKPAEMNNFDIRAEWFSGDGDNFTFTVFNKDIDLPIEFFESAASDTTIAREIINANSAKVSGIEIEALKTLSFLGAAFDSYFVRTNITLQDSELVAGPRADAPTNQIRRMSGASDEVVNLMFGYDSPDAMHSVSLIYNMVGDRLYVAGRNGAPDAFEQPYDSLDLTYSWYPTDKVTVKFKAKNLLDESIRIDRNNTRVFTENIGQSYSLNVMWTPR